jgi:hypothetical protein
MEQLILNIKDSRKLSFLMQLIRQLDFVEVVKVKNSKTSAKNDFFASAGLWKNRKVNVLELRKKAWDRNK